MQPSEVLDLLTDRHPWVQAALLGHVAEAQPLGQPDRPSVPQHLAAVELDEPEDRARGRLPGAVWAEEAEHAPARDRERAVVECLHRPESLGNVLEGQHGRSGDVAARDKQGAGGDERGDVAEQEQSAAPAERT